MGNEQCKNENTLSPKHIRFPNQVMNIYVEISDWIYLLSWNFIWSRDCSAGDFDIKFLDEVGLS